jgi:hypothetical protein
VGKRIEEAENIQEPENDRNYYDRVQDGFDCTLHRNEAVDQPQDNSYYDQYHHYRYQWHWLLTSFVGPSHRLFSM